MTTNTNEINDLQTATRVMEALIKLQESSNNSLNNKPVSDAIASICNFIETYYDEKVKSIS